LEFLKLDVIVELNDSYPWDLVGLEMKFFYKQLSV
jgi:hypothetical protein